MSTSEPSERSVERIRALAAAATAVPACSMSHSPDVPSRWARTSTPRISAAVTGSSCACSRQRSLSTSMSVSGSKMSGSEPGRARRVVGSKVVVMSPRW